MADRHVAVPIYTCCAVTWNSKVQLYCCYDMTWNIEVQPQSMNIEVQIFYDIPR
jgi:hypothetical protein